jgi:hypothetical protein
MEDETVLDYAEALQIERVRERFFRELRLLLAVEIRKAVGY